MESHVKFGPSEGPGQAPLNGSKQLEEELIQLVSKDSLQEINIPKSNEFVINNRGQRLHVRSTFPNKPTKLRCIVFALHGFSIHINNPVHKLFAREYNKRGFGYISLDFHGHGHSEGDRFRIDTYEDLVDDCLSLISAAYSPTEDTKNGKSDSKSKPPFSLNNRNDSVPYFIMAISMGGGTGLAAALELRFAKSFYANNGSQAKLTNRRDGRIPHITPKMADMFAGCVLVCPAIDLKDPGFVLSLLLKSVIVPLFGQFNVPSALQPPEASTSPYRPELLR
jgi:alpha-beta hydrolase superfamily lysophospholipase